MPPPLEMSLSAAPARADAVRGASPPVDQRRRAELFLHALWGGIGDIEVMEAADEGPPRLADGRLWLPRFASVHAARAAAAHAGAHLAFSGPRFDSDGVKDRQRALIEVIEDARVEALAIARFPGLRRLWRSHLALADSDSRDFDHLLRRLARALLEPVLADGDAWIAKAHRRFHAEQRRWEDPRFAYDLGMALANDLGQMRIAMNKGRAFRAGVHRDDNAHLWERARSLAEEQGDPQAVQRVGIRSARLREENRGAVLALAADGVRDAAGGFSIEAPRDRAGLEYRGDETAQRDAQTRLSYPEWDYRIGRLKQGWVGVRETPPGTGGADDAAVADAVLRRHRRVVEQLRKGIAGVRDRHRRLRDQLEGDGLDLDGVIRNAIALRAGHAPDQRVHTRRHTRPAQDLALLVLLDLSDSVNDALPEDPGGTLLDVARDAAVVLADTLSRLGHRYAIHGFNSNGRHALHYQRLLDFDEPFQAVQRARFGAMRGAYSTRLGGAIRHAARRLAEQPAEHRLLLVITDGAPSDIDVHDRRLLIEDARHAVFEALGRQLMPFCLSLDAGATDYVSHIFGAARFSILRRVADLPRRLPAIYFRLVRRCLR